MKKTNMIIISLAILTMMTGCQNSGGGKTAETVPETTAPYMVVEKETVPNASVTENTVLVKFNGEESHQEARMNDKGEKYVMLPFDGKSSASKAEVTIGSYILTAAMTSGTSAEFYENGTVAIYGDAAEYTISIASKDGNNLPGTNWKQISFHGKNGNEVSMNLSKDVLYFRGNDIQGTLINIDAGTPQNLTIDFTDVEYRREAPKSVMLKTENGLASAYIQEENSGDYNTLLTSFVPESEVVIETDADGNPVVPVETDENGTPVETSEDTSEGAVEETAEEITETEGES